MGSQLIVLGLNLGRVRVHFRGRFLRRQQHRHSTDFLRQRYAFLLLRIFVFRGGGFLGVFGSTFVGGTLAGGTGGVALGKTLLRPAGVAAG